MRTWSRLAYDYFNHQALTGVSLSVKEARLLAYESRECNCPTTEVSLAIDPPDTQWSASATAWQRTVVERLIEAGRAIYSKHSVSTIIHGSFSTGRVTSFSDIDLLVIPSSEQIRSRASLRELRNAVAPLNDLIHSVDPLAHHGVMVHSPMAPQHYSEFDLPISTLRCARSLTGLQVRLTASICPRCGQRDAIDFAKRYPAELASLSTQSRDDLYQLKYLMAFCLLYPVIVLEAIHGRFAYKGDAFTDLEQILTPTEIAALAPISELRQTWTVPRSYLAVAHSVRLACQSASMAARAVAKLDRTIHTWWKRAPAQSMRSAAAKLAFEFTKRLAMIGP